MTAALSGTRIERKTIIRRMKLRATTAAMNSGRRLAMRAERSMNTAVEPVTKAVAPLPCVAAGRTESRRRRTTALVAASWGDDFGIAFSTAVLAEGLRAGGLTAATSGSPLTAGTIFASAA